MMPGEAALLGACGLYCGACYHHRASQPGGRHLLEAVLRSGQAAEGYLCRGCRSGRLYMHPGCARCEIRACADRHGVAHCGDCQEFPCARLEAFREDGRLHHRDVVAQLEERRLGVEEWLAVQAARWRCACGEGYSWYEERCAHCGAVLDSYGPDPTGRAPT